MSKESIKKLRMENFMKRQLIILSIFCLLFAVNIFAQTVPVNQKSGESVENAINRSDSISAEAASKMALNVGAKIPSFELQNEKNELITSSELLKQGNLVLVFYRGAWCPYCNTYLKKLQNNIDKITENGGKLVAISVENPDNSMAVAKKNELKFTVLSDTHLDVARKFGIVYQLPPETDERYKGFGIDLVKQNGTETPDLPLSATYVVKQNGEIAYAFLEPDYKRRAEPSEIVEVLIKIKKPSEANALTNEK